MSLSRPPLHNPEALRTVIAHDVDEHACNLSNWEQSYDQISTGQFLGTLEEWTADGLQIFRERNSLAVRQSCSAWHDAFWFGIEVGSGGMRINGRKVDPGMVMVRPGHREFELMTPDRHEILGIVIQRNTLLEMVEQLGCKLEWSSLASAELLHVDQGSLHACQQHIRALLDLGVGSSEHALHQDHVVSMLLAMLDTSTVETRACASLIRRRNIVGDAHEYVMSNQELTVTVPMLCNHLHVSRRTLQYCFEDVLGISPMTYLRSLRLNGVRRQLLHSAADNAGISPRISDVAAAWGYNNFSQFSSSYKKLFGESPSSARRCP